MTSASTVAHRGREIQRDAARHPATRSIARIGLTARAVLYAAIAILALQVAYGRERRRLDSEGALSAVARQPFGRFLLVLLAMGFLAHALWRLTEAAASHPGRDHDGMKRTIDAGRALVYGALCATAIAFLVSSRGPRTEGEQEMTARVLDWPGGRALVVIAGIALIATGIANLVQVARGAWRKNVDLATHSEATRRAVTAIATVGLLARAAVFASIGIFVVKAAAEYEPDEAVGLDGALHRFAHGPYGVAVLTAVAVGLFAYALYSAVEAALRPSAET